jgi:hypothetical protein
MATRTELVWTFAPAELFACPYTDLESGLRFDAGKVAADVSPGELISGLLIERLSLIAEAEVTARGIAAHRETSFVRAPRVNEYDEQGNCTAHITVSDVVRVTVSAPSADVQVIAADGTVIRDTKTERLAHQERFARQLAPKLAKSTWLSDLASIYGRAVADPADEFVHLYEIRDRLTTEFGSASDAREALGLSKTEWDRIGILANRLPIIVGRHRGEFAELRPPTEQELAEARDAARTLLLAAADNVP